MNNSLNRRLKRGLKHPLRAILFVFIKLQNLWIDIIKSRGRQLSDLRELNEIKIRALRRTDISDHLEILFIESMMVKPKLIVELGVRNGESNFALERVARLCLAKLVSVDLDDCSNISKYKDWYFIQKNDLEFAGEFEQWCKNRKI